MLKKPASVVLASFRPSTYRRGYAFESSLAAALLDGHFEHPARMFYSSPPHREPLLAAACLVPLKEFGRRRTVPY